MILNKKNKKQARDIFLKIINIGLNFKLGEKVIEKRLTDREKKLIISDLSEDGSSVNDILKEFETLILPSCTNFSSTKFLGFPDSGNSVGAISGGILSDFFQQNLINQSICSPSATFVEIAVINWLRDTVGYKKQEIDDIWGVGGIITPGGTLSNTVGMLLARENKQSNTLKNGVKNPTSYKIIVPKGIGHYSVKSAQMWIGCGNNLIEVATDNFRYNLFELEKVLRKNKGNVMALIAYAGDSRTMTVDYFDLIADLVKKIDPKIWLHADACHGFSLGFSRKLRHKIKGIERFDSISMDPHKVMLTPYTISALLVKDPSKMKMVTSLSDLIMQEPFAFGQITPFLGSKSWMSLKLWFMMKTFGKKGLDDLITERNKLAIYLSNLLKNDNDFIVINDVEINAVLFLYSGGKKLRIEELNKINKIIYKNIINEGLYHLHQFSIPDNGIFKKDELLYPLRFMCGNPNTTKKDINTLVEYIRKLGIKALINK